MANTKENDQGRNAYNQQSFLNAPQGFTGMSRDGSSSNLLKKDGSENRLVEDKQLGPQKMKLKVAANVQAGAGSQGGSASRLASGIPRPASKLAGKGKGEEAEDDEDYEEGFDDADDGGVDEMERLRHAMAKEKHKAHKFNEKQ